MEIDGPTYILHYWGEDKPCYTLDVFLSLALQIWYEGDPGHTPQHIVDLIERLSKQCEATFLGTSTGP